MRVVLKALILQSPILVFFNYYFSSSFFLRSSDKDEKGRFLPDPSDPYFSNASFFSISSNNLILNVTFLLFNHQIWGNYGDPRIALVMTVFLGFLMVSKIRFSKFPLISLKEGKSNTLSLFGVGLISLSAFFFQGLVNYWINKI